MCGRFGASFQYRDIKIVWNLYGDFLGFFPRYNIASSQDVPVIVRNDGRNELRSLRWDASGWMGGSAHGRWLSTLYCSLCPRSQWKLTRFRRS
jgi:putative SOS response-associated peptidase YedK